MSQGKGGLFLRSASCVGHSERFRVQFPFDSPVRPLRPALGTFDGFARDVVKEGLAFIVEHFLFLFLFVLAGTRLVSGIILLIRIAIYFSLSIF